jgi:pyruvate-formate lyase-activating enzyme
VRRDGFELDGIRQRVSPSHVILIDEEADGATSLAALMKIENLLKLEPHIGQAVVIGDRRKYCVALVTLEAEEVGRWARGRGLVVTGGEALAAHPAVRKLIEGEVARVNGQLASFESTGYCPASARSKGGS